MTLPFVNEMPCLPCAATLRSMLAYDLSVFGSSDAVVDSDGMVSNREMQSRFATTVARRCLTERTGQEPEAVAEVDGEAVLAEAIVRASGGDVREKDLILMLKRRLPPFKVPETLVLFCEDQVRQTVSARIKKPEFQRMLAFELAHSSAQAGR